jgi:hypothetical protein
VYGIQDKVIIRNIASKSFGNAGKLRFVGKAVKNHITLIKKFRADSIKLWLLFVVVWNVISNSVERNRFSIWKRILD